MNSHIEIASISKYYNKARFGYEQALVLWTECETAKMGIQDAICKMLDISIQRDQYETALPLFEDVQEYSSDLELITHYQTELEVLQKREITRQKIVQSQDRSLTQFT